MSGGCFPGCRPASLFSVLVGRVRVSLETRAAWRDIPSSKYELCGTFFGIPMSWRVQGVQRSVEQQSRAGWWPSFLGIASPRVWPPWQLSRRETSRGHSWPSVLHWQATGKQLEVTRASEPRRKEWREQQAGSRRRSDRCPPAWQSGRLSMRCRRPSKRSTKEMRGRWQLQVNKARGDRCGLAEDEEVVVSA